MSANEFHGCSIGAVANEALTEYLFVDTGGTTATEALKVSLADSGDAPIGIVTDTVASGGQANVALDGVGRLKVDGSGTAIVAGDRLKPNASAIGIKTTTDTDFYGARALEPSTASGDIIRVLIEKGFVAG